MKKFTFNILNKKMVKSTRYYSDGVTSVVIVKFTDKSELRISYDKGEGSVHYIDSDNKVTVLSTNVMEEEVKSSD